VTVNGKLIETEGNQPIALAQIVIKKVNRSTSSDMEGNFVLREIPPSTYDLLIIAAGYDDTTILITIPENLTVFQLDTIKLPSKVILLKEVEVTSSVIKLGDEQKNPTATSTVTTREIQEQMGSTEFPEILKSTPGIYTSMAGGSLGAGRVNVRGFSSENTAVMINGIPMNDMENGRVFWSNWGGLNDVTRYKQVQRGLGNSRLAVSSVGGTINILSKPTEMRKGVGLQYALTNSSYRNKIMLTASTGLVKNWAVTVSGSRRWGSGYRPGTYTDSWAYYASVYKKAGENHQFLFTVFGAPQKTGIGYSATQLEYETYGYDYNKAWGYYNGEEKNRSVNQFHKPQIMLSHYFDISKKSKLTTNVYTSIGRGGQTNIQRTVGSSSLNSSYFYDENGQFNWDTLYALNSSNITTSQTNIGQVSGARSKYYLENRHNDHNWYGLLTFLKSDITDKFSLTIGLDGRLYKGKHYATVEDILGGKYFIDQDQFKNDADFDANTPNKAVTTGDTVRYNYTSHVNWIGAFAQSDYSVGKFDFFVTANISNTSYYREGKFNPAAYDVAGVSGYGKSEILSFMNFTSKGGIGYRLSGRHHLFFNGGYFNRAPFFSNAFVDPRFSNQVIDDLKNEEMKSVEGGYGYRSGKFTINIDLYYTVRDNFSTTESYLVDGGDFSDFMINNIGAIHKGVEVEAKLKPMRKLELNGMISIGDWRWSKNGTATVRNNNTLLISQSQQTIYIEGLPVGNAAQSIAALRARYQLPLFAYIGIGWNYFDRLFLDYSPAYRITPIYEEPIQLNSFDTYDLFAGKSFRLKNAGHTIRLLFNVNNLLNRQLLIDGNESPGNPPFLQTGRPRTYNISINYQF